MALNKKYAADLRPGAPTSKKPPIPPTAGESDSDDEYASSPVDGGEEDMGDLFGDVEDDADMEDMEPMDLGAATDEDILAEARKRGLSLGPTKPKPKPSSYRSGAEDTEADEDSLN